MESDLPRVYGLSLESVCVLVGLTLVGAGAGLLSPRRQSISQPRSPVLGRLLIALGLLLEVTAITIEVFTP